jgi:hypothetical protein
MTSDKFSTGFLSLVINTLGKQACEGVRPSPSVLTYGIHKEENMMGGCLVKKFVEDGTHRIETTIEASDGGVDFAAVIVSVRRKVVSEKYVEPPLNASLEVKLVHAE